MASADVERPPCRTSSECVIPNDRLFDQQWELLSDERTRVHGDSPATPGADIDVSHAWATTRGGPEVTVAVVDSGIDTAHPDLAGRVADSVALNVSADTSDGRGHGTATAGAIGASADNAIGIAGVVWDARLLNVKVSADDPAANPTTCEIIAHGVEWATDHGAQIINVSLGLGVGCPALLAATDGAWAAGALVVASAGNGGDDYLVYPAAYPHVLSVAATDDRDRLASFSQRGAWVSLAAPGVAIPATFPTSTNGSGVRNYGYTSGTSIAAPLVAGAAALVWPLVRDVDGDGRVNDDVAARLTSAADAIPGTGTLWRYGRLNTCRAVTDDAPICARQRPASPADSAPAPADPPAGAPDERPSTAAAAELPGAPAAAPIAAAPATAKLAMIARAETDVRQAVQRYLLALRRRDGGGICARLTPNARRALVRRANAARPGVVGCPRAARRLTSRADGAFKITRVITHGATAAVRFANQGVSSQRIASLRLVRRDGHWLITTI